MFRFWSHFWVLVLILVPLLGSCPHFVSHSGPSLWFLFRLCSHSGLCACSYFVPIRVLVPILFPTSGTILVRSCCHFAPIVVPLFGSCSHFVSIPAPLLGYCSFGFLFSLSSDSGPTFGSRFVSILVRFWGSCFRFVLILVPVLGSCSHFVHILVHFRVLVSTLFRSWSYFCVLISYSGSTFVLCSCSHFVFFWSLSGS